MALDKGNAKDSLFGNIKKAAEQAKTDEVIAVAQPAIEPEPIVHKEQAPSNWSIPTTSRPKARWHTLEKVTVLMTEEQKLGLDLLAKKMLKRRAKALSGRFDKERISANMIVRGLIECLLQSGKIEEIPVLHDENDMIEWLKNIFQIMPTQEK